MRAKSGLEKQRAVLAKRGQIAALKQSVLKSRQKIAAITAEVKEMRKVR